MFDIDEAFAEKVDTNATDFAVDDVNSDSDDIAIDNSKIFELTGQHEIPSDVGVPLPEPKKEKEPEAAPVESATENKKTIAEAGTNETQTEIGVSTDDLTEKLGNDETAVFDDAPSRNAVCLLYTSPSPRDRG